MTAPLATHPAMPIAERQQCTAIKMRHCGSGAFDVRYTLNSGAKSDVAGCPSWI
jgi:hypothetical protein